MRLVDANVLIYAVNEDAEHHEASRRWLDDALSGSETVGFAWPVLLAFLRLATHPAVFPRPLTVADALDRVDAWLGSPAAIIVEPSAQHPHLLRRLLTDVGSGGNVVNDAHLAAMATELRAAIATFDNDFLRFPGVEVVRPAA